MAISGDLLVALLALVVAGYGGQADTSIVSYPDKDTDRPSTTATSTGPPLSTAMYLLKLPDPEPADPCKAGNYTMHLFFFYLPCCLFIHSTA